MYPSSEASLSLVRYIASDRQQHWRIAYSTACSGIVFSPAFHGTPTRLRRSALGFANLSLALPFCITHRFAPQSLNVCFMFSCPETDTCEIVITEDQYIV